MSFDEIVDLAAGAYFNFYNIEGMETKREKKTCAGRPGGLLPYVVVNLEHYYYFYCDDISILEAGVQISIQRWCTHVETIRFKTILDIRPENGLSRKKYTKVPLIP